MFRAVHSIGRHPWNQAASSRRRKVGDCCPDILDQVRHGHVIPGIATLLGLRARSRRLRMLWLATNGWQVATKVAVESFMTRPCATTVSRRGCRGNRSRCHAFPAWRQPPADAGCN